MTHTLKKYTGNRGSALFMVISTMTALMIAVMAMYFSVSSSRNIQYAMFNQEQSYQSAVSISDIVGKVLMADDSVKEIFFDLAPGETLSSGSGFESLGSGDEFGKYTTEITRTDDGTSNKAVFDIAVTTDVNGNLEVVHTYVTVTLDETVVPPSTTPDNNPNTIFSATGYTPNDVYLEHGAYMTDVFFDNEYTYINLSENGACFLNGNLSTGGSLIFPKSQSALKNINGVDHFKGSARPTTWNIRGDCTFNTNQAFGLLEGSVIVVGGDLHLDNNVTLGSDPYTNLNVYVLGDIYMGSSFYGYNKCNFYCAGDVHLSFSYTQFNKLYLSDTSEIIYDSDSQWAGSIWMGGKEYKNGSIITEPFKQQNSSTILKWDDKTPGGMSIMDIADQLAAATDTRPYYKWTLNDNNNKGEEYIKELDEKADTKGLYKRVITLDASNASNNITSGCNMYTIAYPGSDLDPGKSSEHVYVGKGLVIEDIKIVNNTLQAPVLILIDTGNDPENKMYIRVKANIDSDGKNGDDSFSWLGDAYKVPNTTQNINILVKGQGSLVIDIPQGVTYQDTQAQILMHYSWFTLMGGTVTTPNGQPITKDNVEAGRCVVFPKEVIVDNTPVLKSNQFVHATCGGAGDTCSYSDRESTITCSNDKCKRYGKPMLTVSCATHGDMTTYCPGCQEAYVTKDTNGNYTAMCAAHVDRKAIDAYLAKSENANLKKLLTNSKGTTDYPTTNIFLVSCDESANIRLSGLPDGSGIQNNAFFGYIYAPYMTFKAIGQSAGYTANRFMGGLTVSDYFLNDYYAFTACYPEKMPTELMPPSALGDTLSGYDNKEWKISILGH